MYLERLEFETYEEAENYLRTIGLKEGDVSDLIIEMAEKGKMLYSDVRPSALEPGKYFGIPVNDDFKGYDLNNYDDDPELYDKHSEEELFTFDEETMLIDFGDCYQRKPKYVLYYKNEEIALTKKGIPCFWECGGGYTNTGSSLLIGDSKGDKKKAVYVRRKGHLACSNHALVPIRKGDIVVEASHHRGDFTIHIFVIAVIDKNLKQAMLILADRFEGNEWDTDFHNKINQDIIENAKDKAESYHCRSPFYIIEPDYSKVGK